VAAAAESPAAAAASDAVEQQQQQQNQYLVDQLFNALGSEKDSNLLVMSRKEPLLVLSLYT
jgi:hypothetical protein